MNTVTDAEITHRAVGSTGVFGHLSGWQHALIALSYYRHRHQYKVRDPKRKSCLVARRIKDLSASGDAVSACRRAIARARAAGWRGSVVAAVSGPNTHSPIRAGGNGGAQDQ